MRRTIHAIDGEKLRRIRDEQGFSSRQLALKVGMDPGYLHRIEKGTQQPSPSMRKQITDALGIKLDDIRKVDSPAVEPVPQAA